MSTPASKSAPKTLEDWMALPDDARFELIDGEFVEKAAPTFDHGRAQGNAVISIGGPFSRKPGAREHPVDGGSRPRSISRSMGAATGSTISWTAR